MAESTDEAIQKFGDYLTESGITNEIIIADEIKILRYEIQIIKEND